MTTGQKLMKTKMNLPDLASYLQNVSEARRVMGYSRDTFYRVQKACNEDGLEALPERSVLTLTKYRETWITGWRNIMRKDPIRDSFF